METVSFDNAKAEAMVVVSMLVSVHSLAKLAEVCQRCSPQRSSPDVGYFDELVKQHRRQNDRYLDRTVGRNAER